MIVPEHPVPVQLGGLRLHGQVQADAAHPRDGAAPRREEEAQTGGRLQKGYLPHLQQVTQEVVLPPVP